MLAASVSNVDSDIIRGRKFAPLAIAASSGQLAAEPVGEETGKTAANFKIKSDVVNTIVTSREREREISSC